MSNPDQTPVESVEEILKPLVKGSDYASNIEVLAEALTALQTLRRQNSLELLDRLVNELSMAERLAWSDEDGKYMSTVVFQTNMRAWIQAERNRLHG